MQPGCGNLFIYFQKIELSDGSSGGDPNDPNNPNNNNNNNGLTEGEIAGIVIGSVAGVFLIVAGIAYVMKRNGKKKKTTQVLPMHATHHSSFDEVKILHRDSVHGNFRDLWR